jgi:hypothetical protein
MCPVTGEGKARPPEAPLQWTSVPYSNGLSNAGWRLSLAVFPSRAPVVNTLATGLD